MKYIAGKILNVVQKEILNIMQKNIEFVAGKI